ncbi:hypothetical protein D918_03441 [Trichuris suis]|nr:hypothetical protein D918_03441 [Trichuris suis]
MPKTEMTSKAGTNEQTEKETAHLPAVRNEIIGTTDYDIRIQIFRWSVLQDVEDNSSFRSRQSSLKFTIRVNPKMTVSVLPCQGIANFTTVGIADLRIVNIALD